MVGLLLAIIYLAFISLGLPDSLLGAGWPVMHVALGAPLSSAGIITMIISVCSITSSVLSDRLTRKVGIGWVIAGSVVLTAAAMLLFSFSTKFWMLCVFAIPYGLGAGAIDAALNNYVSLHFSSRHMSWLHCCWGVGATISPYIMSACLTGSWGWEGGYRTVAIIQFALSAIMFIALPLWKKKQSVGTAAESEEAVHLSIPQIFKLKGTAVMFVAFFAYCALEQTTMLWASSYFVGVYSLAEDFAAQLGSMVFIGVTAGRAISGFVANKAGDRMLIRIGTCILVVGIVLVAIPTGSFISAAVGFVLMGLGCAPIYPSIVHSTPFNFGKQYSQSIIGVQMGFAYIGSTFMSPLFGVIAQCTSIRWLPLYIGVFTALMLVLTEVLNRIVKQRQATELTADITAE